MGATIGKMFFAYGLTAAVSMIVAVLIKLMTTILSSTQKPKASAGVRTPVAGSALLPLSVQAAVGGGTDIAVIAAAVYAAIGSRVRIVRIQREGQSTLWAATGRLVHQTSHVLTRRPPYKAT